MKGGSILRSDTEREELRKKIVDYFRVSKMDVAQIHQELLLEELLRTEKEGSCPVRAHTEVKEEWMWSIHEEFQKQQIFPTVRWEIIKFMVEINRSIGEKMRLLRF